MGIETILEELQPNPLQVQVNRMKETVREMAGYYYKGFGALVSGILANGELFLGEQERNDLLEKSYDWFSRVENFYSKIPFGLLQGREEFYPLFVVRDLLPKFRDSMDEIFKEKRKDVLRNFERIAQTIVDIGTLYRNKLEQLLEKIRLFPEEKDFKVAIPDQLKDYTWYF